MTKAKPRDRDIRFTRKELFVFISFVFVSMGIMFVLGIYVGRGMSPVRFDIENLQNELAGLKDAMMRAEGVQTQVLEKELARQSEYDFFKQVRNPTGDLMFPKEESIPNQPAPLAGVPVSPAPVPVEEEAFLEESAQDQEPAPDSNEEQPELEAEEEAEPEPEPKPPAKDDKDAWTIQMAAVAKRDEALKMVDKYSKMGYPAYMQEARPEGGKIIYRIRMGHFENREDAKALGRKLSKDWGDYLILKE